ERWRGVFSREPIQSVQRAQLVRRLPRGHSGQPVAIAFRLLASLMRLSEQPASVGLEVELPYLLLAVTFIADLLERLEHLGLILGRVRLQQPRAARHRLVGDPSP